MVIGAPVSTREWANLGQLANWLAAKGACIVPDTRLADPGLSSGSVVTYRFRVRTRATALQRVWLIRVSGSSFAPGVPSFRFRIPAGTGTWRSAASVYTEDVASPGAGLAELSIDLEVAKDLHPHSITVYEQDRASLDTSTGEGVDVASLRSGQPIAAGITGVSVGGIYDVPIDPRRSGLAHLAYGIAGSSAGASKSGSGYTSLTPLPLMMLAQRRRQGATTGDVYVTAYARMTGAGTGHIRITRVRDSAQTVIDVTGTSWGWTTPVAVPVDCDDMSATDGLRGNSFDGLTVEIEGAGTSTLELQTVSFLGDALD